MANRTTTSKSSETIYFIHHNHFDTIWRRGWKRGIRHKGLRYASFSEIEALVIGDWIKIAEKGFPFAEGQAAVLREYCRMHPGAQEKLRELAQRGTFEALGAGEVIVDSQIPCGEAILRNYFYGQRWNREALGAESKIAWIADAFGSSAQLPQIFRQLGMTHVMMRAYSFAKGDYWRGLDGSIVFAREAPHFIGAGMDAKYLPHARCKGEGCKACDGTGLADVETRRPTIESLVKGLLTDLGGDSWGVVLPYGEETMPNRNPEKAVEEARRLMPHRKIVPATFAVMQQEFAEELARLDNPPEDRVSQRPEGDPAATGGLVSRIKLKQNNRRLENLLLRAETAAACAWSLGAKYPSRALLNAWRTLCFTDFHDAITSTHVDGAYAELIAMQRQVQRSAEKIFRTAVEDLGKVSSELDKRKGSAGIMVFNRHGFRRGGIVMLNGVPKKVKTLRGPSGRVYQVNRTEEGAWCRLDDGEIPALGWAVLRVVSGKGVETGGESGDGLELQDGKFGNQSLSATFGRSGLLSLKDRKTGKIVLSDPVSAIRLVLEEDLGNAWMTEVAPSFSRALVPERIEMIREVGRAGVAWMGTIKRGEDADVKRLEWRLECSLAPDSRQLDVRAGLDWDTRDRRVRLVCQTAGGANEGVYEIPYGHIERGKYEVTYGQGLAGNGDWPTQNWVAVRVVGKQWVAVLNQGLPSNYVSEGRIETSLLRSPTRAFCLEGPEGYVSPSFDGARDSGLHEFNLALLPFEEDHAFCAPIQAGKEFNDPLEGMYLEQVKAMGSKERRGARSETNGESASRKNEEITFLDMAQSPGVWLEAVKKAEDRDSLILRFLSSQPKKAVALKFESLWKKEDMNAILADETTVERTGTQAEAMGSIKPFQVKGVEVKRL